MAIKYTIQGLLIYITLAAYVAAFAASMLHFIRFGRFLYFIGFAFSVVAWGYRWYHVQHVPMQNLFEVFLCLSIVIFPLTLFSQKLLGVGGQIADILMGAIILVPAGFVFSAEPQNLPPALQSWLFAPHVAAYMLSYVIMAKAAVQAVCQLRRNSVLDNQQVSFEDGTYRMVCLGFPLLTIGLLLGSLWGKLAWGDYWGWDPKELWSLVCWIIYLGYFHFHYATGRKFPRAQSWLVIMGMAAIIATLLWVNLSKLFPGLHAYAT